MPASPARDHPTLGANPTLEPPQIVPALGTLPRLRPAARVPEPGGWRGDEQEREPEGDVHFGECPPAKGLGRIIKPPPKGWPRSPTKEMKETRLRKRVGSKEAPRSVQLPTPDGSHNGDVGAVPIHVPTVPDRSAGDNERGNGSNQARPLQPSPRDKPSFPFRCHMRMVADRRSQCETDGPPSTSAWHTHAPHASMVPRSRRNTVQLCWSARVYTNPLPPASRRGAVRRKRQLRELSHLRRRAVQAKHAVR